MKVIDLKVAVIREMKDVFSDWNIMAEGDPLCVEEGEFNSNILLCEGTDEIWQEVKSCWKENGCEPWQAARFYADVMEALVAVK